MRHFFDELNKQQGLGILCHSFRRAAGSSYSWGLYIIYIANSSHPYDYLYRLWDAISLYFIIHHMTVALKLVNKQRKYIYIYWNAELAEYLIRNTIKIISIIDIRYNF